VVFVYACFPSTAMDMPQKEVFEKLILEVAKGRGASHSCYRVVANLIQLTTGRANELWNVAGLVPLTFFLEPQPKQADNQISTHRPLIACLPFGDQDSQIAVALRTGALEVLRHYDPRWVGYCLLATIIKGLQV
jgi:hypothetical protein